MSDQCAECGHDAESHRPSDPDGIWECHEVDEVTGEVCDCPEFMPTKFDPEQAQLEVAKYSKASAQVMTPEQAGTDEVARANSAQKLLVSGHTWSEIAEMTGYLNAADAQMSVRRMRQQAALRLDADLRAEILDLEMDRLNEIIKAYWPTAMAGEVKHAELVLKVIAQQARMLGLEELHTQAVQSTKTIIIAGNSEEYARALQSIAERS